MDELRFWIVTYSTGFQIHADTPQPSRVTTRDSDVDGFTFHMQTILGNLVTPSSQHGVRFRRTVSGNNMKPRRPIKRSGNGIQQVQQFSTNGFNISGTIISENIVDFLQRIILIAALGEIICIEFLTGVDIIQKECAF